MPAILFTAANNVMMDIGIIPLLRSLQCLIGALAAMLNALVVLLENAESLVGCLIEHLVVEDNSCVNSHPWRLNAPTNEEDISSDLFFLVAFIVFVVIWVEVILPILMNRRTTLLLFKGERAQ